MAFVHGKNTKIYCNGYNLSSYLNNIELPGNVDVSEVSTFTNPSGKTYIAGLKDATISTSGYYDGSSEAIDEVLRTLLGSNNINWCCFINSDNVGSVGYGLQSINNTVSITSDMGDATAISGEGQSNVSKERIICLHSLIEETNSGTGDGIDDGVVSFNGGSAYIQATDVSGTLNVSVEQADDISFTSPTILASFSEITTSHSSERISFSGSVEQYIRIIWTLTGGNATFNVGFHRGGI